MKRTSSLCRGVALGALMTFGLTAQAEAQTASPEAATDSGLDEIVVTAQRREQNSQDVPISITAASSAMLDRVNVKTALDVNKIAPAVVVQTADGTVTAFMRGIGNNITAVGNEQSTAIYIDGVYNIRLTPALLRLNSVERMEVLKGPQGTLFGRNATAGLIQIITREPKPGSDVKADFRLGYGNYQTFDGSAYLSSGLGDKVAADLALSYYDQHKGWGKDLFTGRDANREKSYAVRSKWVFEPSDYTKIVASGDYSYNNGDIGVGGPYNGPGASGGGFADGSGRLPDYGFYNTSNDVRRFTRTKSYGGMIRFEQELSFAKITDIVAYRRLTQNYAQDVDFSSQPAYAAQFPSYARQFSNEFQLSSKAESKVEWIAGLYYLWQKQAYAPAIFSGTNFGGPASQIEGPAIASTKSYSAYAQATVPVMDRVRLTLGARYSKDKAHSEGGVNANVFGVGIFPVQPYSSANKTFNKLTWKGVIDYKPSDDLMLYVSASRGFKGGVFSLLTYDPVPAKSEVLDTYEVGFKSQLLDDKLRLNGAFFYNDWSNPQVINYPTVGRSTLTNAGKARIWGLEFDANAVVTPQFNLRFSGSYLNGKYTDYQGAPSFVILNTPPYGLIPGPNFDATGNRVSRAPKFSGIAGFQYRVPVGENEISFAGNYSYTGSFYWHPDNVIKSKAYGLIDANITYTFNNDHASIKVWGSNLGKKKYYNVVYELAGVSGTSSAPGAPRTYGVTLGYKF